MGKSAWGHGLSCCSDECGERVRGALELAKDDDRYKFFQTMRGHAEQMMAAIETDEIASARVRAGGPESLPDQFSFVRDCGKW